MSSVEEPSSEAAEVKEPEEFDADTEDNFRDGYGTDPPRYTFYR